MPQQVTPYVLYEDTNAAIDWLTSAFGFTEVLRYEDDGVVTHAELELEGGTIYLGHPGSDYKSPANVGVTVGIHFCVADIDAHHERTNAAGAKVMNEPHEPGYGDRRYDVEDLEGHHWFFATQLEEKAPEDWGATKKA